MTILATINHKLKLTYGNYQLHHLKLNESPLITTTKQIIDHAVTLAGQKREGGWVKHSTTSASYEAPSDNYDLGADLTNSIYAHLRTQLYNEYISNQALAPLFCKTIDQYRANWASQAAYNGMANYLTRVRKQNDDKANPMSKQAMQLEYEVLSNSGLSMDAQLDLVKTKWLKDCANYICNHNDALASDTLVKQQVQQNYQNILQTVDYIKFKQQYLDYQLLESLAKRLTEITPNNSFDDQIVEQAKKLTNLADVMYYIAFNFDLMTLNQAIYLDSSYDENTLTIQLIKLFIDQWSKQYTTNDYLIDMQNDFNSMDINAIRSYRQLFDKVTLNISKFCKTIN